MNELNNQLAQTTNKAPISLIIWFIGVSVLLVLASIFIPKIFKGIGKLKIGKNGIELDPEQVKQIESRTSVNIHEIQRKQLSFVNEYLKNVGNEICEYIEKQGYRSLDFPVALVAELVQDEIVSWLIFNSIENTTEYVSLHQDKLWLIYSNAIWSSMVGMENVRVLYKDNFIARKDCTIDFKSSFFKNLIFKVTKDVVENLVKIKTMHNC